MNYAGVIDADDAVLDKLLVAINHGKLIDGHAPTVMGSNLNAYSAPGIRGDHECATVEEMQARISCGMYVLLRQGSACHNLRPLLKGVTPEKPPLRFFAQMIGSRKPFSRRAHIDNHLRICRRRGLDPVSAIAWRRSRRRMLASQRPRRGRSGLRADIVLLDDLKDFRVRKVWLAEKLCAVDGDYLPAVHRPTFWGSLPRRISP